MDLEEFPKYEFLDVGVHPLTKAELLRVIESTVDSNAENSVIGNHNLHSLCLVRHDATMMRFYRANQLTHVDGVSVILLARLFGFPLCRKHKTAYQDWFDELARFAEGRAWRLFFVGGTPQVAAGLPTRLKERFPRLEIRSHDGYDVFQPKTTVFAEIERFHPHVVFVGMGMPLQERWIMEARERVCVNLFLPCGGFIDLLMGVQRLPPRWIGQIGFEWLWRLCLHPVALFHRYLVEPWALLPFVFAQWRRSQRLDEKGIN